VKRPGEGCITTTPMATQMRKVFGGPDHGSVGLTASQMTALCKLYGVDPAGNVLEKAGAERNILRHAEADGMRLVAWIARYTESGQDPLKVLVQLACASGLDVEPGDSKWSEEDD